MWDQAYEEMVCLASNIPVGSRKVYNNKTKQNKTKHTPLHTHTQKQTHSFTPITHNL